MEAINPKRVRLRWLIYSIGGLVTIGAGVSITGQAIIEKGAGNPWFILGTLGLVVLNAGVSVFGQGVVYRIDYLSLRNGR